jgi:hypothetical protein
MVRDMGKTMAMEVKINISSATRIEPAIGCNTRKGIEAHPAMRINNPTACAPPFTFKG